MTEIIKTYWIEICISIIIIASIPSFLFGILPIIAVAPPWWFPRILKNIMGRSSGFGGCQCCGDTWNWKLIHHTDILDDAGEVNGGVFPLCEECWNGLGSPERRMPYYLQLMQVWRERSSPRERIHIDEARWPSIKDSVEKGG